MCSSDVVAAIAVISPIKQPKMFSLVFGEGITNDAVSIILFNTVYNFAGPGSTFSSWTPFAIVLSFIMLTIGSMLIGLVVGFTSSLVFKHFRFLTNSPIIECNMVFCLAYVSYSISELFEFSGIITLLTTGIVMGHFTWYNLSN
jgi:NhaP-type Na+/H+ or K+/H+ antiporter